MGEIDQAARQRTDELVIDHTSDCDRVKGAIGSDYTVELAGAAFLDEVGAVGGGGGDQLGEVGEGFPGFVGADDEVRTEGDCNDGMVRTTGQCFPAGGPWVSCWSPW